MALITDSFGGDTGIFSVFGRARTALSSARARRVAYVRTYNELSGLTDRELNDLGLSRVDIGRVARGASR